MTEQDYLDKLRAICAEHGAERVVLFGSRARGTNRPNSDFDIAVYGCSDVRAVAEAVDELPTLYSADIIDMETLGSKTLVKEIEAHGIAI